MIVAGLLVTLVPLELDIFIAGILIDEDVGICLGEVVSHLSHFVKGVVIIQERYRPEVGRVASESAVVILVGNDSRGQ
ncbi:hypothetical protein ES703_112269 [subsurface metagenome]